MSITFDKYAYYYKVKTQQCDILDISTCRIEEIKSGSF